MTENDAGTRTDADPLVTAVMTPRIVAITPDAPLHTALRLMASGNVRHLPVIDGPRCLGVLTETDLVRAVAVGSPPLVGPLARPVPTVPVGWRRSRTARALLAGDVDAVLVTDDDRLVGIVTTSDLVRTLAEEPPAHRGDPGPGPVAAGTGPKVPTGPGPDRLGRR